MWVSHARCAYWRNQSAGFDGRGSIYPWQDLSPGMIIVDKSIRNRRPRLIRVADDEVHGTTNSVNDCPQSECARNLPSLRRGDGVCLKDVHILEAAERAYDINQPDVLRKPNPRSPMQTSTRHNASLYGGDRRPASVASLRVVVDATMEE